MATGYGVSPDWVTNTVEGRNHMANKGLVRNGLVLLLDAGATDSYPGTGTTFYDKSTSNNNGTLQNGVQYSTNNFGALVFDGTDDYIDFSSISGDKTIQLFAKADSGYAVGLRCLVGQTVTGDGALRMEQNSFRRPGDQNDFQKDNSTEFWINSIKDPGDNGSGRFDIPTNTLTLPFFISCRTSFSVSTISHTFNNRVFAGEFYLLAVYNRFLSDTEVRKNYNALKGRFGL